MQYLLSTVILAATVCALPQHNKLYPRQNVTAGATGNRLIPVIVGGQQDVFIPSVLTATVGDVVQFQFSNGNHTATQSNQDVACTPLLGGIHSGHVPFVDGQATVGTFNLPITSTETIFMYCATGPHCQLGQVLVINPANDLQVVNYAKLSQAAPANVDAGGVIGGTVAEIPLAAAAFTPAPPREAGPPGGPPPGPPPGPPAESPAEPPSGAIPVEATPPVATIPLPIIAAPAESHSVPPIIAAGAATTHQA